MPRKPSLKDSYSPSSTKFDDPFLSFQSGRLDVLLPKAKPNLQTPQSKFEQSPRFDIKAFEMQYPDFEALGEVSYPKLGHENAPIDSSNVSVETPNYAPIIPQKPSFLVQAGRIDMQAPPLPPKPTSSTSMLPPGEIVTNFSSLSSIYSQPPDLPASNIFASSANNNLNAKITNQMQALTVANTPPLRMPGNQRYGQEVIPVSYPVPKARAASSSNTVLQQNRYFQTLAQPSAPSLPPKIRQKSFTAISNSVGMAGLKNLGNTCFMNSTIQCLSGTGPLARYFLDGSYKRHLCRENPLSSKGRIADSYSQLIKSMWLSQEGVINPSQFKNVVGDILPSFAGNQQQDSQEFLAFILDSLHEDLNLARQGNPRFPNDPESDSDGIPDNVLMKREWEKYRKRNWSIIVDMFQGSLKSYLACQTCGKSSTTFNPFMYLTLPIPPKNRRGTDGGAVFIEECLAKFLEHETLDGDNSWHCPRCKVPRKSTKYLSIAKLPTVLIIHLKRFSFQGPFRNKLETYVEFPVQYSMPNIARLI